MVCFSQRQRQLGELTRSRATCSYCLGACDHSFSVYCRHARSAGVLARKPKQQPAGPRALGAPPGAWRGGAGSPRGSLEEVVSLGDCWVNHVASSRDYCAGSTRAGWSARAVRDASLGGRVGTSRLQQRICDSALFMQDLSAGSLLRQSHLLGGGGGRGRSPQAQSFSTPHHSSVLS